jgi:hypothetical protein
MNLGRDFQRLLSDFLFVFVLPWPAMVAFAPPSLYMGELYNTGHQRHPYGCRIPTHYTLTTSAMPPRGQINT